MKQRAKKLKAKSLQAEENKVYQSHDALFKAAMRDLEVAQDLIKAHIPKWLSERIRWDTLRPFYTNLIKDSLEQLHSDVVLLCLIEDDSSLYFLIEHQSTPDESFPFRMLKYKLELMEEHLANGHEHLPLVIDICVYAGDKSPYSYSFDVHDCSENKALSQLLMFKEAYRSDLTIYTEELFKQYGRAELLGKLLKQGPQKEFVQWIKQHSQLIEKLLEKNYRKKVLSYIFEHDKQNSPQQIIDTIISLIPKQATTVMSAAQQLRNEGREEGREEGIEKGIEKGMQSRNLAIARSMLEDKEPIAKILRWTGLNEGQIQGLQS